jgi:hypothetical protein
MQPGIHECSIHPQKKLNPPAAGGIGKKGVLVNTPTLTWMYTRTIQRKGEKKREIRNSGNSLQLGVLFI